MWWLIPLALAIAGALTWRVRNRYNLKHLNALIPAEEESVFCRHCTEVYSSKFPVCPTCGRAPEN